MACTVYRLSSINDYIPQAQRLAQSSIACHGQKLNQPTHWRLCSTSGTASHSGGRSTTVAQSGYLFVLPLWSGIQGGVGGQTLTLLCKRHTGPSSHGIPAILLSHIAIELHTRRVLFVILHITAKCETRHSSDITYGIFRVSATHQFHSPEPLPCAILPFGIWANDVEYSED